MHSSPDDGADVSRTYEGKSEQQPEIFRQAALPYQRQQYENRDWMPGHAKGLALCSNVRHRVVSDHVQRRSGDVQ